MVRYFTQIDVVWLMRILNILCSSGVINKKFINWCDKSSWCCDVNQNKKQCIYIYIICVYIYIYICVCVCMWRKNNEFVLITWKVFVFKYIYKWMYLTKRKEFVFKYISKYLTPYLVSYARYKWQSSYFWINLKKECFNKVHQCI